MRDLDAAARQAWDTYGLDPYGTDTPLWAHVAGRRIHLLGYDWQNSEHRVIEGAWAVDVDHVPGELGKAERGDVVLYVGKADGVRDVLVWPPALVIHAGRASDGDRKVISLTNRNLTPIPRRSLSSPLRARLDQPPAVLTPTIRDKVLGLWRLDVMCPQCGAAGTRVQYGFPSLGRGNDGHGGGEGLSLPPPGHTGCLPPEDGHEWECDNCEWQWPGNDPIVESLAEACALHRCDGVDGLEAAVRAETENDDISVRVEGLATQIVRFDFLGRTRSVQFPFYMSEFWDAVLMVRADAGVVEGWMPPIYA